MHIAELQGSLQGGGLARCSFSKIKLNYLATSYSVQMILKANQSLETIIFMKPPRYMLLNKRILASPEMF